MNAAHDSLEVLNGSGHLTLSWDPSDPEEVAKARAEVENLRQAGYTFFAVVGSTGADEVEAGDGTLLVERVKEPVQYATLSEPAPAPTPTLAKPTVKAQCQGTKADGNRCTRKVFGEYCPWHGPKGRRRDKRPANKPKGGKRHVAVRRMAGG